MPVDENSIGARMLPNPLEERLPISRRVFFWEGATSKRHLHAAIESEMMVRCNSTPFLLSISEEEYFSDNPLDIFKDIFPGVTRGRRSIPDCFHDKLLTKNSYCQKTWLGMLERKPEKAEEKHVRMLYTEKPIITICWHFSLTSCLV